MLSLDQSHFLKTVVSIFGDDDVVEDTNVENCGGLCELFVNLEVGVAGVQDAGRVIVREDDGGGAIGDDVGKHRQGVRGRRYCNDVFDQVALGEFKGGQDLTGMGKPDT